MVQYSGTLVPTPDTPGDGANAGDAGAFTSSNDLVDGGTMIAHDTGTLVATALDTMVINSDDSEGDGDKTLARSSREGHGDGEVEEGEEESTMKRHDTGPGESGKKYRPLFLDHFDKKEAENFKPSQGASNGPKSPLTPPAETRERKAQQRSSVESPTAQPPSPHHGTPRPQHPPAPALHSPQSPAPPPLTPEERQRFQNHLQRQLNQISGAPPGIGGGMGVSAAMLAMSVAGSPGGGVPGGAHLQHHPFHNANANQHVPRHENQAKFQRAFADGDFEFLKFLSYEDLQQRMANLDSEMEREIDELRRRYQTKRQPILDAMDQKRKRQQNF
ncbi:hypothetical protein J437_LFUL003065 [Ladona fulva]|uniref:SARAH domain-containing protein n=1 Tax=Ladona fulva TaxID=123851 RepID=A0A8K0NWK7_LADFU|nr:hypothetical protein J437_LFUL003065 [Ladona fulva]